MKAFNFCSEVFGDMRNSTEEEKQLYEDMLDKLSTDTSLFEREYLGERVKPTCEDCANLLCSGDCRMNAQHYYEDAASCERFKWKH